MAALQNITFNIDVLIVFVFLILNLAVGFYYGRGVKTIEDFALGGRNFSTAALVSTIVATAVTGSLFTVGISRTYSTGLYDLIPTCGMAISLIIIAYFFIPRMTSFIGNISIAESIGNHYGTSARIITALCAIVANVGAIAVQFKVFGGMIGYFLDFGPIVTLIVENLHIDPSYKIDSLIAVLLSGTVVTLYSAFGGIRAVTFTDILQFMVFGTVIPLIGIILWKTTLNTEDFSLAVSLQNPNFSLKEVFNYNNSSFWEMVFLFLYFTIPSMHPAYYQRIIMGRDIRQVKTAFSLSAIILLCIILSVAWIGFLIFALKQDLASNQIIPYIIDNYTYVGFKGFVVVGVMAMAMSSADSFINVASVLFAHDICKPLNIFVQKELLLTKIFALLIGSGSIWLALSERELFSIVLSCNAFYLPIVTVPLLLTICGLKTTKLSALTGMGAGFITVVIWKTIGIEFDPIIPAMFVNLVFILGTHYLLRQEGGWVNMLVEEDEDYDIPPIYITPRKLTLSELIVKNSPKDDATYSFFGIFCFISTMTGIYLTHDYLLGKYADIMLVIYEIMLVLSTMFMLYMMWSPRIKHPVIVGIIWNIAITYILTFCSSLFLVLSNFNHLQLTVFTLNLTVLFSLCRWKVALIVTALGFSAGMIVYSYLDLNLKLDFNYGSLIYVAVVSAAVVTMFFKPKEEYIEKTEAKVYCLEDEVGSLNEKITDLHRVVIHYDERVHDQQQEIERLGATAQKILNNVNHELRLPVGNVMNFAEMISEGLGKLSEKDLKMMSDEVLKNSNRLSTMILNMLDLATLDVNKIELQKKTINFSELVEDRVRNCRKVYLQDKPINFELNIQPNIFILVDPNYIRQTVDNLVINAINYSRDGVIKVDVRRLANNIAELTITDQGIGIPPSDIYDIFTPFKMGIKTESKAQGRGVGLALCKSAVEAHGGTISVESDGKKGALFRVRLIM